MWEEESIEKSGDCACDLMRIHMLAILYREQDVGKSGDVEMVDIYI